MICALPRWDSSGLAGTLIVGMAISATNQIGQEAKSEIQTGPRAPAILAWPPEVAARSSL